MKKFRTLSLSTQIFFLITSFILILILLQFIIYRILFLGFYQDSRLDNIESEIAEYVIDLKSHDNNNYFETITDFTSKNNIISLILDNDFNTVDSETSHYIIEVTTSTFEEYKIRLPEPNNKIKVHDRVEAELISLADKEYEVISLKVNNEDLYNLTCTDCVPVVAKGVVTNIEVPKNLNYDFGKFQVTTTEVLYLQSNKDKLTEEQYLDGHRYPHETQFSKNEVYLHKISDDYWVMNIYIMESSEEVLNILSTYNLTIYAVMLLLAITISIIVSRMISKPIKSIDDVAKEISNLNFDIKANEYQNKETSSLTENINTIGVNLRNNIDKLNKRNNEVVYLYEQQTSQVELRKRFISAISHELKTPLMVMNITIQGILDGIFSQEDQDDELRRVLAEITNTDVMIKDLLDVFKLDDMIVKNLDKINLKTVTQNILNSVENLTKQYKQEVILDTARSPIIYGDFKLISMVVSNLITNAIKYTPENEKIHISILSIKDSITFSVTNYGVQIPEESLEHLFEPFYRVDKSRKKTTKTKGTGLGLYIVSETLKAHGFEFGVENIDNGVTSWFTAVKNKKNLKTR
ncbi:HAMP domain-containing sensor histidine kinase [Mycoplasmatota bacterium WC44]